MWPFRKTPSQSDAVLAIIDEAIELAADRWKHFCRTLPVKSSVTLRERITVFAMPFEAGLREQFAALRTAPSGLCLLIIAKGVERSLTATREEIEAALDLKLP